MSDSTLTVYNDRYELQRRVARGGNADVFLARDRVLDRPVALKILFSERADDQVWVERFRKEAQAVAKLSHPNIVEAYDWGQKGNTYYLVMEFVEGRSLAEVLRTEGPLHPDRAAEIASDVAAALGFAHASGVVHTDVKPGNIMITEQGRVKVADFGTFQEIAAGPDEGERSAMVLGTAAYFSPEQALGKQCDPRSDLYSLGVVLYEMVTGKPPFDGATPVDVARKHVTEVPVAPSAAGVAIPAGVESVIMKLLAKNPANRYATAEDLAADLKRFRDGAAVQAEPIMEAPLIGIDLVGLDPFDDEALAAILPPPEPPPRSKRTGAFVALLALLLLALAGLVTLFVRNLDDESALTSITEVPNVVEVDVAIATELLEQAGFEVEVVEEANDQFARGIVFGQDPIGGAKVEDGSVITLRVSRGVQAVAVPSVVDLAAPDAQALLEKLGFLVQVDRLNDDEVPKDFVISQSPTAGEEADEGSTIVLTVSDGPESVKVPDLRNKPVIEAAATLGGLEFTIKVVEEPSDTIPEGTVIRTSPPGNSEIPKGSEVTLFVSKGLATTVVPTVVGLTQQVAVGQIQAAGFNLSVSFAVVPKGSPNIGRVITQSPAGGAEAPNASVVTLIIGMEDPTPTTPTSSSSTTSTTSTSTTSTTSTTTSTTTTTTIP